MKKALFLSLFAALTLLIAAPAMAQGDGAAAGADWKVAAAALGLGIAAAGGALAQGRAAADALAGIARNPGAAGRIQTAMLLALAFMESIVIFAWVMVLILQLGLGGG